MITLLRRPVRRWDLEPDFLTVGKSIAAGVSAGRVRDERRDRRADRAARGSLGVVSGAFVDEVATGGTLFGNALSMAAGRAALTEVLTEEAFDRTAALGERMAAGLRAAIESAGLDWSVAQLGGHAFYFSTGFEDRRRSRAADRPRALRARSARSPTRSSRASAADVGRQPRSRGRPLRHRIAAAPCATRRG